MNRKLVMALTLSTALAGLAGGVYAQQPPKPEEEKPQLEQQAPQPDPEKPDKPGEQN